MISTVLLAFLLGCVVAWAFRVWILVPIFVVIFLTALLALLLTGSGLGHALLCSAIVAWAPQLGFGCALAGRCVLAALRSPGFQPSSDLKRRRTADA